MFGLGKTAAPGNTHPARGQDEGKLGAVLYLHGAGRVPVRVLAEVAASPVARTVGLAGRMGLAPDQGMLFVFPSAAERSFWMRGTALSLDMLFVGVDRRILGIVERAEPFTDSPRTVPGLALYVLEVPGGFAGARGVAAGDLLEIAGLVAMEGA
jgi:hypothetical protein